MTQVTSLRERIPIQIFDAPRLVDQEVARHISELIRSRAAKGKNTVLGLPTGSTTLGVYKELVRLHRDEGLDFSTVITFNLDEYYPISSASLQSYYRYMHENLFNHINVPTENIHLISGDLPAEHLDSFCIEYEKKIEECGGLDLVLLGIGRSGHIGFNEPGSRRATRTRVVTLSQLTRKDAASKFYGIGNVPRKAVSMGVGTILDAREIILIATGEHKAEIIRQTIEGRVSETVVASYLQNHPDATVFVDRPAAGKLTRMERPWLVEDLQWNYEEAKKAVLWLSELLNKALLRLEAADFHKNSLHSLVYACEDIDALCLRIFNDLRQRIAYAEDLPADSRVILFSPHPDDDVISMGGMLEKVVRNNNDVLVAYMTNGSVAVFDEDVRRYLDFVEMSYHELGLSMDEFSHFLDHKKRIHQFFQSKKPGDVDLEPIQHIKACIRYSEAIAGIVVMGLSRKNARFLDLPFYHTGRVKKKPVGDVDYAIILNLLRAHRPDHIFVAGDLSDPHGTHRMCYMAIKGALELYRQEDADGPKIWLYRGAWQEWEIHRADIFMPMSKAEMNRKIEAIFKHESQKDRAMFPGAHDEREFWQRALDRNRGTATTLNRLGLPEFYAAEAFVTTDTL